MFPFEAQKYYLRSNVWLLARVDFDKGKRRWHIDKGGKREETINLWESRSFSLEEKKYAVSPAKVIEFESAVMVLRQIVWGFSRSPECQVESSEKESNIACAK